MDLIKKLIAKELINIAHKIENGTCEMSENEMTEVLSIVAHESMSKYQACQYLNLKTSRFDDLVREGVIPKGKKITGFKELRWYKDELIPLTRQ